MSFSALDTSHANAGEIEVMRSSAELVHADLRGPVAIARHQDSQVYRNAAATLLPHWLRILTPSPWSLALKNHRASAISIQTQQLRLAASWAAAKLAEVEANDDDIVTYSGLAKATLIHWQLGLLSDGQPQRMADRKSDALFPAAWYVVRMLEDTTIGTTPLLLSDLAKHLNWIATRQSTSSWSQATAVGALAGGGVLLRDSRLVTLARKRLSHLIATQSSEGWFPEASRFDIIKQAQVIGVLGQLYHAYNWSALETPLTRAVGFFAGITAIETGPLALSPPMAASFLFPQGFELLADQMPAAAKVTNCCRRLAAAMATAKKTDYRFSDELAALAGGDMLAAMAAKPIARTAHDALSANGPATAIHHEAGLATFRLDQYVAVLSTKNCGAWQAHWPSCDRSIFDPPIALVGSTGRLRSACSKHVTIKAFESDSIEVIGYFNDSRGKRNRHTSVKHKLYRDGFRRVLTFLEDEIRVLDEVWCALPCQSILLQFADTDAVANSLGSAHLLPQTPLIVSGGRGVVVERVYQSGQLIQLCRRDATSLESN